MKVNTDTFRKKQNMENKTKDAGKEQRVVLNLSMAQAKELNEFFESALVKCETDDGRDMAGKIQKRIQKTINKHETEGAIAGVITAAQEVINEQEGDKCPGCGSRATLPEPNGQLLCENCGATWNNKQEVQ